MARIDSFLRLLVDQKGSDLHIRAGHQPVVRHCGDLHRLAFREFFAGRNGGLLEEVVSPEQLAALLQAREIDFAYNLAGVARFRAHAFIHSGGMGAVFRAIPNKVRGSTTSVFLPAIARLAQETKGLILVTGPTGCGKSTTMAALVRAINESSSASHHHPRGPDRVHPREHPELVTQRQIGLHAESFAAAMRSALREAPDVLVVGEMRDRETMSLALSAAETGILVIATLDTPLDHRAIDRIVDTFEDDAGNRSEARSVV